MQCIKDIKKHLDDTATSLFSTTVFGPWLQLKSFERDPMLVHAVLQSQIPSRHTDRLLFNIGGHEMTFNREAFCLVTGMRFGASSGVYPKFGTCFLDKLLPKPRKVKDLMDIVNKPSDLNLSAGDSVRLCLLLLVHRGFLGREQKSHLIEPLVDLVESLDAWNDYPWGLVCWNVLFPSIHGRLGPREANQRQRLATTGNVAQYSLLGFFFAFTVIRNLKKHVIYIDYFVYVSNHLFFVDMDL